MENDSRSNYPASFDLINYMERILKPFMDERYKADIEDINRVEKPQGITPIQIQNNRRAYDKKTMDMKHEALMCLAFRNGFLGNKKTQAETQTMRDDHEQVL
ncbi:hypothetical protein [Methanomethylovorans sp.]|nr:hypothetical protein [Methanomethylovorans sp.]